MGCLNVVHAINLDSADTMLRELWNFLHCNALSGTLELMFFGLTGLKTPLLTTLPAIARGDPLYLFHF